MAGCVRFHRFSQCHSLYWTAEVGILPHITVFPCCKTLTLESCHSKNTLRYGRVEPEMKWRATLFPGWHFSLRAQARCQIFQYILGVWNLLNATVTNVEILHSAAKKPSFYILLPQWYVSLHNYSHISLVLVLYSFKKVPRIHIFCHVSSCQANDDRRLSVDLLQRCVTDKCWNTTHCICNSFFCTEAQYFHDTCKKSESVGQKNMHSSSESLVI